MSLPTKKDACKWANALRSGKYKQGRGALQAVKGYCCLGVACDVFVPKEKQKRVYRRLVGTLPYDQPHVPSWLATVNSDVQDLIGNSLSNLNDEDELSFDEIADIVELLFVHRVAETLN